MTPEERAINSKLNGLMGMAEMELAVAIIIRHAKERGVSFQKTAIDPTWFVERDMHGFIQLCLNGWIDAGYPNSVFLPSSGLATRVVARFPELGPVSPKSAMECFMEQFEETDFGIDSQKLAGILRPEAK